jgi:tetratricopeptide (TPR) repeat protein
VVDDLARVTPDRRVADALEALGEATQAFSAGKYAKALRHARNAKELSPRDTTVREVLGLSAYRTGDWREALRELRTYRRLSGASTHLPVEMDALRALGRHDDVERAWEQLRGHAVHPAVLKEGTVVYASHLIDVGRIDEARALVRPRRLDDDPFEEDLRLWYVAARAAAMEGDTDDAGRLRNAILRHDPSFPGIDELEALIARPG